MRAIKITLVFLISFCITGLLVATPVTAKKKDSHRSALEENLLESFTLYVCQRTGKNLSDVSVSQFKVVGERQLPAGTKTIRVFQKKSADLEGYVRLAATISIDGKVANMVKLYGWVDVYDMVVVARRSMKKGNIIGRTDIEIKRKNISHLPEDTLKEIDQAVGLRTKHSLRDGAVLKGWMLEKTPVVERGDVVTILAQGGNLRITVPGIVQETGFSGDLIKVKNTMSRKNVFARVVNSSTVTVHF
jgi:flagellar basal body P-ring formation protein FlgA